MPTAPGFAHCSYELRHASMSRSAFITFAIDPVETNPQTLATTLNGVYNATGSLKACIDSSVTMVGCRVALGTDGIEDLTGFATTSVVGGFVGSTTPPNCATLVHKRTARGGRRGRGRMYIPWSISASTVTENGTLAAADMTRVNDAFATWFAALTSGPGPLVILHKPSKPGTERPTTPGAPNVVTSFSVDPLIGTQRRRLGR